MTDGGADGGGSGGEAGGSGGAMGSGGTAGGSGGSSGHDAAGDTAASCAALEQMYADAVPAARSCNARITDQCTRTASPSLAPCAFGCQVSVHDDTMLNQIKKQWMDAGCAQRQTPLPCPRIACPAPSGICQPPATDGPGTCGGPAF